MDINNFSIIGKDHKMCQDYSMSGLDPFPFFIISDGCSSGINTDVGSRIIVNIAKRNLYLLQYGYENFIKSTMINSKDVALLMGLPIQTLLATLYIVAKIKDKVVILSIGDGDILYKQNNEITTINFEYSNNTPFYPIYMENSFSKENFLTITTNNEKELKEFSFINYIELDLKDLDWVVCSTDGLRSFTNGSDIHCMSDISDFKQLKGEFIERKMNRIIKSLSKEGYYNSDDWTMGGMSFGGVV